MQFKTIKKIKRISKINQVLTYYRLDEMLLSNTKYSWLIWSNLILPWNWRLKSKDSRAVRLRLALEELGPIFIKLGQALSTRKDLIPEDISIELSKLQDDCPPFNTKVSVEIIETALKKPINKAFFEFNHVPIASASMAQVHAATLLDGTDVVVKVVRPDIIEVIKQDISLMFSLASLIEVAIKEAKRLHPVEIVEEFEKSLLDEMDMIREAANTLQLRRNFKNSDLLYVPKIYWSHTNDKVLTQERIKGTRVSETDILKEKGIALTDLSTKGVTIFFTQVFKHNFFHADMHPGNIFVLDDGRYAAIDFGIMGTLTPEDQRYLAENFLAFFNRDYLRVAELHIESGWVPHNTRVNELESAIRSVCEPIWDRPLKDISFGLFLMRLFQTARRFGMEVQPQLVLLQKTLLNIEGLGRQLDDELDLWNTAKPFLEGWMKERMGLKSLIKNTKNHFPSWIEQSPQLPNLVFSTLDKIARGKIETNNPEIKLLRETIEKQNRTYNSKISGILWILLAFVLPKILEERTFNIEILGWSQITFVVIGLYFLIRK